MGVILDNRLNWKPQIDNLCSSVRKLIFVFKNLKDIADRNRVFKVYNELCKSILRYCITS